MIVAVGAIVIASTGAFFSDTETSTGNTFTAGEIDLTIDSQQHYNGNSCINGFWSGSAAYPVPGSVCFGTWGQIDDAQGLEGINVTSEKFFTFNDLKPGDWGENTISLHVDSNPAWVCANIKVKSDYDVTCTEPEEADDQDCSTDLNAFNGEIAENLSLAWWADDGDSVLEGNENVFFMNGSKLSTLLNGGDTLKLTLADSLQNFFTNLNSGPLNGGTTYYVGMQWCFGDMVINGTTITCNGAPVNNASQSDSLTADISFSAVQSRNNSSFRCKDTYKPAI